jgi:hypothetical protein
VTPMWEPATDIEQRMRDALRAGRQEDYFQILARLDLLLPISDDEASSPNSRGSWATWSAEDRTHVLAFTSVEAMQACLHSHAGNYRMVRFTSLADSWPEPDWWLAIDPGLPIEGYLPAWFVAQVATGDASLPEQSQSHQMLRDQDLTASASLPTAESTWGDADFATPPRYGQTQSYDTGGFGDKLPSRAPAPSYEEPPRYGEQSGFAAHGYDAPQSSYGDPGGYGDRQAGFEEASSFGESSHAPYDASGYDKNRGGYGEQQSGYADDYSQYGDSSQSRYSDGDLGHQSTPASPEPIATDWPAESEVENLLAQAASQGDTAGFLDTLVRSWAYVPIPDNGPGNARPGDPEFRWHTDVIEGEYTVTAFTDPQRLTARYGDMRYVRTTFARLTCEFPGVEYSLYVNPGTEVGANMPGPQVTTFVNWARSKGLLDAALEVERAADSAASPSQQAVVPEMMQKVIPHHQVSMILERGYDRVAGFVYRQADVADLITPEQLYNGLGLVREGGQFSPADESVHIIHWIGHRVELYQIAYGGVDPDMAARNNGWIVEPPPFAGDGFAPGTDGRRIPEYKVDSVRLPHGARMFRLTASGHSVDVATYDADLREWIRNDVNPAGSSWDSAGPYDQEQQHA